MSSKECVQLPSTLSGKWLKRVSIVALLMLPLAVTGFRLQLYPFSIALMLLGVSLLIAAIVFLLALFISLKQAKNNEVNVKYTNAAMLFSLVPLLLLGSQIIKAKSLPVIHNVSTDTENPPEFNKLIAIRGQGSNPHSYDQAKLAKIQTLAYPEIKTLIVEDNITQAFNKSLSVVEKLGWHLVSEDQPNGLIEASQTSKLWGFTDDVVIRVRQKTDKTIIDLRSVSRIGKSDLGANAQRIQKFSDAYFGHVNSE